MSRPTATVLDAAAALPRVRVPGRRGAVATCQHDEDVVTLGARAALRVLDRWQGSPPAAVLLATVTPPLAEGGSVQVLAEVLDLTHSDLLVAEHGGSVAASGGALAAALALVAVQTNPVLVVAADTRRDAAGRALGDGAVAVLLGVGEEGAARLTHVASRAELVRDEWRRPDSTATESADPSFAKVVTHDPEPRADHDQRVAVTVRGPAVDRVGRAGCAAFPLRLIELLDQGDGDAVVTASGVTHRFAFTAGPDATIVAEDVRASIEAGVEAPAPTVPEVAGFDPYASQPRAWRDRAQDLRLVGQRDPRTGEVLFPPVPDAAAGGLEAHRLARSGRVMTFTRDHVFPQGAPVSMAVVELDGGGRFYGQVVDGLEVTIGDRVVLVLRRLHDGGGLPQWFWKVQPLDPAAPMAVTA